MNCFVLREAFHRKDDIGSLHFWINNLKMARPQDVVVLGDERNGKFNLCSNEILSSYHNVVFGCGTLEIYQV